jgi:hypothetical protein
VRTSTTLLFALLVLCGGAALAQTPDLMPPSLETVCDMETGAAYGLCNAYCEAMDCELANDNDPLTEPHASATACAKVWGKFQQITGRDLPCEVSCPCTSIPEFNATLAGAQSCRESDSTIIVSTNPDFDYGDFAGSDSSAFADPVCGYINYYDFTIITLPVSPEQADFCVQLTRDAAAANGVECLPY